MSVEALAAFNLALLAAWAVPGPALLYALHTALARGRGAGVAAGAGLALTAAGWTLLALLGLDALLRLFPWAYAALKFGGAACLLWIAVRTWRQAGAPAEAAAPSAARRAVLGGALVNLANPKSVLLSAAVLVVIFPPDLSPAAMLLVVANHLAFEILAYGVLALLVSTPAVAARYRRAEGALDRVSAAVLGALGLRLMLER